MTEKMKSCNMGGGGGGDVKNDDSRVGVKSGKNSMTSQVPFFI